MRDYSLLRALMAFVGVLLMLWVNDRIPPIASATFWIVFAIQTIGFDICAELRMLRGEAR